MQTDNCTCKDEISIAIPDTDKPRLVIIGGGFAGLYLARRLNRAELQVIMLDRNNFHVFQPLLYQVATAMLEPEAVANSFRKIFKQQENFYFRMMEVERVDPVRKVVVTDIGCLTYDFLVIATGARSNFYGMGDIAEHAYTMKNVHEAIAIRQRIFENFEKALIVKDQGERDSLMSIVIAGGGSTGVEIAGALGELKKYILPYDYKELNLGRMRIFLVEAEDRLLSGMSENASRLAEEGLKKFSVSILLKTKITSYDGKTVLTGDGRKIKTRMLIWVAGVTGNIPAGIDKAALEAGGRIRVDNFNKVTGYDDIYAIGDVAAVITDDTPRGHPMLATVAIQQAENLANNLTITTGRKNGRPRPFVYKDRGIMSTIGRNRAIVETPGFSYGGLPAWITWLFVHLLSLVGFRNKTIALINWAWNYFSYDRGMRLIIPLFRNRRNCDEDKNKCNRLMNQ